MAAPTIQNLPADYSVARSAPPVAIIAHATGGRDSRATLQHGDGRGVSIHVLITKQGLVYRMVPDERGANHAGAPTSHFKLNGIVYMGASVNRTTLGFELENLQRDADPYPDAQLLAMGWIVMTWRVRYGPLPLLRHAELDPSRRVDPLGLSVAQMEAWVARATTPPPTFPTMYKALRKTNVFQRSDGSGPVAGTIEQNQVIAVDALYAGRTAHISKLSPVCADLGFIWLADFVRLP